MTAPMKIDFEAAANARDEAYRYIASQPDLYKMWHEAKSLYRRGVGVRRRELMLTSIIIQQVKEDAFYDGVAHANEDEQMIG